LIKTFVRTALAVCVVALMFPIASAHALSGYLANFETAYSAAKGTRIDSCNLCHDAATFPVRNSYGTAYASAGHSFSAALAALDSDGDTFSNGAEITALTFPGDKLDKPAAPDTLAPVVSFTMPAAATSLSVNVLTFSATDAVGVTGYFLSESAVKPLASAAGWSAPAPKSFTFPAAGSRTLNAWAKDAAGNVSTGVSASTVITLPVVDTQAPQVTFTLPATAASLTVKVLSFSATDNFGVTGYLLSESAVTPLASAAGWSATAPGSFTFPAAGSRTLNAWAKDAAGNVSTVVSATVVITISTTDTVAPVVTFTMPATATSLSVNVLSFSATDNVGVTGYLLNESFVKPLASAAGWSATPQSSYTFPAADTNTIYAWAKDAAGNVSTGVYRIVFITLPAPDTLLPVVAFTMPTTATSLTVNVLSFSATDNVRVTGYLLNESAIKPLAAAAGWSATPPTRFTFPAYGTRTLSAWAKDAAGNVSARVFRTTVITLPKPEAVLPVVTFTMPTTATSLTVKVLSFSATDNVGVTGYLLNESAIKPLASAAGWSATPQSSYTFPAAGTRYLSAWAKDAAGNVSTRVFRTIVITLPKPEAVLPVVTFTMPTTATSLTVKVLSFSATDNVRVTGYLLNESAIKPLASAAGWSATPQSSYTFPAAGTRTLSAWAKDAAGNVSARVFRTTVITLPNPDLVAPVVTFTMPATAASLSVKVLSFSATDSVGVTGYLLSESAVKPLAAAAGWSATPPAGFTFPAAGTRTLRAWAKDAAGNVSAGVSRSVVITLSAPPPGPGFLFGDSFDDVAATGDPDWDYLDGFFGGASGALEALGGKDNLALVTSSAGLDPFAGGIIETDVSVVDADPQTTAAVIFDYQNENNYRFVGLDLNLKRVVVGQVGSFETSEDANESTCAPAARQLAASQPLPASFFNGGAWHHLLVAVDASAGSITVYVDQNATPAVSANVTSTGIGRVGLGANQARQKVFFDDYQVWDATVLP